jgi:phosphate transport system protein
MAPIYSDTTAATLAPPSGEHRARFHQDLRALEDDLEAMALLARAALDRSVEALARADVDLCRAVIERDDEIDRRYIQIEERAIDLIARQQPVASELRLVVAVIHGALHLERIADSAVDVAEAARVSAGLDRSPEIYERLQEMGDTASVMTGLAVEALAGRVLDLCERLPGMDDRLDQLDREMAGLVLDQRDDPTRLGWALQMLRVSRCLERAADHAVDIAEQAWYVMTGELRELD